MAIPSATKRHFHLVNDPDPNSEERPVKFHLTYEGRLDSNGSAKHKHEIRKAFHTQLKRLWDVEPNLAERYRPEEPSWETVARSYERLGYRFVPLAVERLSMIAGIEVLFLRDGALGSIIRSGDIDNRLKTLFDALKMPGHREELGGYGQPAVGEDPFFVLLEDDKLLNHVAVETDMLLEPTPTANGQHLANDCRLIITVILRPSKVTMQNLHFA